MKKAVWWTIGVVVAVVIGYCIAWAGEKEEAILKVQLLSERKAKLEAQYLITNQELKEAQDGLNKILQAEKAQAPAKPAGPAVTPAR